MYQLSKPRLFVFILVLVVGFGLSSCGAMNFMATPTPTSTSTPMPTPTATATPSPLSSSEVFNKLSPSIAYVETVAGSGSGVLIEGGYVVTNAHVVWPFDSVRVVFPNREEFSDVPVLNWDLLGDLAILGPVEADVEPLELVDGEDLPIGSDVYLIGYPGEVDEFPDPTITRGLISRMREWEPIGVTYFQTDAKIGGGQSGGILSSQLGQVIGISNFSFSSADFGLVASAVDVAPRIQQLIDGESLAELGHRHMPLGDAALHRYPLIKLENEWDRQVFILQEPVNTEVTIKVTGTDSDVAFIVRDFYGADPILVDYEYHEAETETWTTNSEAPYFIDLVQSPINNKSLTIESSHKIVPFVDLDDGRKVEKDTPITGHIDYAGDLDYFKLDLKENETVNIFVDSLLVDPFLIVTRPGDGEDQIVGDDDSGEGIFGLNAELTFTSPETDTYLLVIGDGTGVFSGGYSVQVRDEYDGAPTPMAPEPTPIPLDSDFGGMTEYFSEAGPFSVQYPSMWNEELSSIGEWQALCSLASACYLGDALVIIAEEDVSILGELSLGEYVDLYIDAMQQSPLDVRVVSRKGLTTTSSVTGEVIELAFNDLFTIKRFVYLQDGIGFNMSYVFFDEETEELSALVEYSFKTFRVTE